MSKSIRLTDLNERQLEFIMEYVESGDELEAYQIAGYSIANKNWRGEARKKLRELAAYVELAVHERIGGHVAMALNGIVALAENAKSETVKFNALKDILSRAGYDSARVIEDNREKASDMDRTDLYKELGEILGGANPAFIEKMLRDAAIKKAE